MHKSRLNIYNSFVIFLKIIALIIWVSTRETFQKQELLIALLFLLNEARRYYRYRKNIKNKSSMENKSDDYPTSDSSFSNNLELDYFIHCKGTPYFHKGYRAAIKSKPKKAITILIKAAEVADNLRDKSIAYFLIGYCYEQLDDTSSALETYEKAVNTDSNNLFAWKFLGICYSQNGNPEKAISCYKNILAVSPNDAETLASLGGAYIRLEDYHLGIKVLEDTLYYYPTFIIALSNICIAYAGIGDKDNVDKYMKQLVDLNSPEFDSNRYHTLKVRVDYLLEQNT